MTNVIVLKPQRRVGAAPTSGSTEARIVFFTGVRYVRDHDPVRTADLDLRGLPDPVAIATGRADADDRRQA